MLFFEFKININLFYREKKQKIEDIKKNIRDAILVSCSYSLIVLLLLNILSLFYFFYRQLQVPWAHSPHQYN